ncbi:MAG: tyrosine--tRNA ligase [Deltaproteobacteria bacterium]|nr:MAG: tyrosine--tRNA ligase [Deltaproteobacteria bacterium]
MKNLPEDFEPKSPALRTLVERGYLEQATDLEGLDKALSSESVTFYVGFDPTADSLHVGSMLQLMLMRVLQRHGHRPIVLVGGGTALVGDPSGRSETRKMLDPATIEANCGAITEQIRKFLVFDAGEPHDAMIVDNAAWLLDLRYIDFLREIGVHFTVNRMIATKTYRERLEQELPLSFLEFNYQILQAYDFLQLYQAHDCRLQCGGSDQWGNIVAGVELIRRHLGPEHHAFGLTIELLTTADGKKMGKTERGAVYLDPKRVSPFDFYQYWIGCDDRDVGRFLRLFTELPLSRIEELTAESGAALRRAKAVLAFEVTRLVHGETEARNAEIASLQAYGGSTDWSAVPAVTAPASPIRLVDLVTQPPLAVFASKRRARQRIEAGAVKLDGETVTDPHLVLTHEMSGEHGIRLQAGKKTRYRVIIPPPANDEGA